MNGRDYALIQLDGRRLPRWPDQLLRGQKQLVAPPDPRDRALGEQITAGVVKNLLLLQYLIEHYSGRPLKNIDSLVQKILAVALYQLRFLTRVPANAAVDEAVKQAKRFGRTKAAGFVNAVLRNATREPDPPLPAEQDDPQGFGEIVLSHPPQLLARLTELLGIADALRVCRHDNAEPPTIVRLFAGQSPEALHAQGVTFTPHEQPGMFVVEGAKHAVLAAWAKAGVAQVQDPTAAIVADACDVSPGQIVLDRCAGLGTKTLQLRERLGDTGELFAVDASAARCEGLQQLIAARGLHNVHVSHGSMLSKLGDQLPRTFDRVLVDAPCSNSGVLARRPEARYAQDENTLASLAKLQRSILKDTAPHVASDGLLVYSTCSIWPEENERMVAVFLREHPSFELVNERATLPSLSDDAARYRDGGYFAVMRKRVYP